MYYVWKSDSELAKTYMHVSTSPDESNHDQWITGEALSKKPKVITLTGDNDSPAKLSDVLLSGFDSIPVLSPGAISALEKAGVDNIEYFPINIKHKKMREVEKSYKIANIIGLIHCLDKKRAKFTTFATDPNEISFLQKYSLLEGKIGKKAPLVFRLGEFPHHVLAHESVKKAFEKAGLSGAEFISSEKYV